MSQRSIDKETVSVKDKPKPFHVIRFDFTIKANAEQEKELLELSLKIQESLNVTCQEKGFFISFLNLNYNNPKDLP